MQIAQLAQRQASCAQVTGLDGRKRCRRRIPGWRLKSEPNMKVSVASHNSLHEPHGLHDVFRFRTSSKAPNCGTSHRCLCCSLALVVSPTRSIMCRHRIFFDQTFTRQKQRGMFTFICSAAIRRSKSIRLASGAPNGGAAHASDPLGKETGELRAGDWKCAHSYLRLPTSAQA